MAHAELGKPRMFDKLWGKSKEKQTPEQEWQAVFSQRLGNLPLERLTDGKTNITIQRFGEEYSFAHLDTGDKHAGRITVAMDTTGVFTLVGSVAVAGDEVTRAGHAWSIIPANQAQLEKYLKSNISVLKKASVFDPDGKNAWKGQAPENAEISRAIRVAQARNQ